MKQYDIEDFFSNETNTGLISVDWFEEYLNARYPGASQIDVDFYAPVLFYEYEGNLVGYYDLEMKQGYTL